MAKKTYTVKTPIEHNGERYAIADSIELDDKTEAPQLLDVGAVDLVKTAAKSAVKAEDK